MPTRREEVRQGRLADEGRQQSPALTDLLNGGAEQHHRIRSREAADGAEAELDLAGTPLVLHRAGRQPDRGQAVADRLQRVGHAVQPYLREELVALLKDAYVWWWRGEAGVLRHDPLGAKPDDVILDLNPGEEVVARIAEFPQHAAHQAAPVQRHRLAVGEIDVAEQPARMVGPPQEPGGGRI